MESYVNLCVCGNVHGEKYILKINPSDPERYIPIDWKPIFTMDEKRSFTKGILIDDIESLYAIPFLKKAGDSSASYCVFYAYYVLDSKYERCQHLPPNFKKLYRNLQKGQSYQVEYLDEDPRRAIIYLDTPIMDSI